MAGREEVSLSPHTVLAPEVPLPGSRLALIARNSLLFTSLAVRLGGAPDLLVYGLCTDNAVYLIVNVPVKVRNLSFLLTLTKRVKNRRFK